MRAALEAAARLGCETRAFGGPDLPQAFFSVESGERCAPARALIEALRGADGVIIASPGYHGSISGLVKNALDYVEDLSGDTRPYLDGRAIGLIVTANGPQALGSTLAALRSIAHALRGWPTPYAALINSGVTEAGPHPLTPAETVGQQVAEFALRWRRQA